MSKFCPSCGNCCEDNQVFCTCCGTKLPDVENQQPTWQSAPQQAPTYNQQYPQQPYNQQPYNTQPVYGMNVGENMKWFKFIIYFQLFAAAVVQIFTGIHLLMENAQFSSQGVSEFFQSYIVTNVIFAIISFACGAWAFFVRSRLAKFKAGAPKLYLIFIAAITVSTLSYVLIVNGIFSSMGFIGANAITIDWVSIISSVTTNIVIIVINYIYFKKRSPLFVN